MSDSKHIDDGGLAFPVVKSSLRREHAREAHRFTEDYETTGGMNLRQWYAGQALPGLIHGYAVAYGSPTNAIAEICTEAVNFADELILALKAGG